MAQQKKGLIARMLEGKEKSEEYARSTLPTNRWQLFWDIFKGNFWKIVKVNLLMLIFFIPIIFVVVFNILTSQTNGILYPFAANLGVGYPAMPALQGVSEWLSVQSDLVTYLGIAVASLIASVGLAGGMYVIRNMVWTEGIFVANDFWRGVKLNYKNALQTALFFCVILFVTMTLSDLSELSIAMGTVSNGQKTWLRISQAMGYVLLTIGALMSLWMIALGVNYNMKFGAMFKNSFLMVIGTLPQTVFFGVIAMIPFILFLFSSTFFIMLALIITLLFAFAYFLLVWLDFAQWVFDKYINPKLKGAKVGRGIYSREDGSSMTTGGESAAALEYQRVILSHGKSRLVARPIKPIDDSLQVYELPQSFTREDLKRLRESKQSIVEDTEAYAEEHKNDLRYVEYNKQFEERERALQDDTTKKKKRAKPPKMLGE